MAVGVQAWAVAWVVCLAGHAHAQLGVRGSGGGTGGVGVTPATTTTTTYNQLVPGIREKGRKGGREDPAVLTEPRSWTEPWLWVPLEKTYQGCFTEESFNGTLMFVDLTQAMEVHKASSVEEACFHMCRRKDPYSTYIAVSPAVSSGGGGDGCGCKDYLDPNNEVDGDSCDEVLGHYRAYCGPNNWDCINRAGQVTTASTLLISSLLTLLLFGVSHYGA